MIQRLNDNVLSHDFNFSIKPAAAISGVVITLACLYLQPNKIVEIVTASSLGCLGAWAVNNCMDSQQTNPELSLNDSHKQIYLSVKDGDWERLIELFNYEVNVEYDETFKAAILWKAAHDEDESLVECLTSAYCSIDSLILDDSSMAKKAEDLANRLEELTKSEDSC